MVSGDTVKVRVPGVGVDRNGDPVTVTGITSAPRLGRISSVGGNFLEYQAYPRTVGTDEFTYSVVDSQGAFATGTVRVAVVELGQPQPPLAVEDRLTVEPGRTATFDPLANDFIAPGDSVEVEILDGPDGARLDPDTNLVTVPAPDSAKAPPTVLVYRVTNGIDESRATMTLTTADGYENPPIVYDAFGRADDSGSVVVDVLEGAYDPDGAAEDLEVVEVSGDPSARVVDGVAGPRRPRRGPQGAALRGRATPTARPPPPRSTSRPPATACPTSCPGRSSSSTPGTASTGKVSDYIAAPDGGQVRLASGRRSYVRLARRPHRRPRRRQPASPCPPRPASADRARCSSRSRPRPTPAATRTPRRPRTASPPSSPSRCVVGDDTPSLECPDQRHPDVGRPALRPRHRLLLHGLHRRPPRRRRTRLLGRVEPGRRGRGRQQPPGLGRRGHGVRLRDRGRRGRPRRARG